MIFQTMNAKGPNSSTGPKLERNVYFVSWQSVNLARVNQAGINNSTSSLLKFNPESAWQSQIPGI